MSAEGKQELVRVLCMTALVAFEWYAMQPYHEPFVARMWNYLAAVYRRIAEIAGRAAITAENNYYTAAGLGL